MPFNQLEYQSKYYILNIDKIKEYSKNYYNKNKHNGKPTYYECNKQYCKRQSKKYYEEKKMFKNQINNSVKKRTASIQLALDNLLIKKQIFIEQLLKEKQDTPYENVDVL
jgi:hypothetical protein